MEPIWKNDLSMHLVSESKNHATIMVNLKNSQWHIDFSGVNLCEKIEEVYSMDVG